MRPRDLIPIIDLLFEANIPTIIWGPGGAGKSSVVRYITEQRGIDQFDLRLATQEITEIVGYPRLDLLKDIFGWAKPEWFREDGKWLLLLDEANRAERRIIQAVFQLITDRRLHTHVLHPDVRIMVCCNPPGEGNIVNRLDDPFLTRFAHITLEPNVEDLVTYCPDLFDPDILNFLLSHPKQLMDLKSDFDVESVRKRTPRTWAYLSHVLEASKRLFGTDVKRFTKEQTANLTQACAACVGSPSAIDFVNWNKHHWTRIEDILDGKKQIKDIQNDSDLVRLIVFMVTPHTDQLLQNNKTSQANLSRFLSDTVNKRPDLAVAVTAKMNKEKYPNLYNVVMNNSDFLAASVDAYASSI